MRKTRCQRRDHQRIDFKWTERSERIRDESLRGENTKETESVRVTSEKLPPKKIQLLVSAACRT